MHGLKVPKNEGEKVRQLLIERKLLLLQYRIRRDEAFLYFPVKEQLPGYESVECSFERKPEPPQSLEKFEIRTFDIIGDIAIVDIPENVQNQRKEIAQILLSRKPVHTVVQKSSRVDGEFRTRTFEYLAGEPKTETVHTEYGLKFKVDISKVYFNPRLATERWRIAQKVQPGETVTDMFCGVGPFSIMISKFARAEKIYAIDINPEAIRFLRENVKLNRVKNVVPVLGDARKEILRIGHSDRIIMNLPQKAFEYLPEALQCGRIIHYYRITADIQGEIEKVKALCRKMGKPSKIPTYKTVKSYSPDMELYRIDILCSSLSGSTPRSSRPSV